MKTKYILTENTYFEFGERRVGYGIAATVKKDGIETVVEEYRDMSPDRDKIIVLVKLCNKGRLSLIHFADVVEDFVTIQ